MHFNTKQAPRITIQVQPQIHQLMFSSSRSLDKFVNSIYWINSQKPHHEALHECIGSENLGLWKISSTVNFLTIPCQMKKSIMIKIETI